MGFLKRKMAEWWAFSNHKKENNWKYNPVETQNKWFKELIEKAKNTQFGREHFFSEIQTIQDFQEKVLISDYENIKPYVERIKNGEKDILWPGKPIYIAKTSGTTSGSKYIPITKDSIPFHIQGAQSALLNYIYKKQKSRLIDGKMIFLQGNPELKELNGIKVGRLSGISAHFVPSYLQKNRMPSWETNCIEDWETKVNKIVEETLREDMALISGIPPWLVMYFEKLIEKSGKSITQLYPNLQLLITGGVNYKPYKEKIEDLIGKELDIIQTYPASEGFIAYQDEIGRDDLLLLLNHGIFYEFIPSEEIGKEKPKRLTIGEVELNKDYAIILTTNAGLWAYQIGDLIRFVSTNPYRIIVSGRTKHYTSAFGEHVISYEVEEAIKEVSEQTGTVIHEFTLAPQVNPAEGLPYHEWFIEFEREPEDPLDFSAKLDLALRKRNSYYNDLISGRILKPLKISFIQKNGFTNYMKDIGKLGGQNKLPRLSNDRKIADSLEKYTKTNF